MTTDAKQSATEKMVEDYMAAWSSHDVERLLAFFTDDGVYEDAAAGTRYCGTTELKAFFEHVFTTVAGFTLDPKKIHATDEGYGCEWVMSGNTGGSSNIGMFATASHFAVRGASVGELRGGKISRNCDFWDMATMRKQLETKPSS